MTELVCLCGETRLRVQGQPLAQFYCHCDDCQAVHGAAYTGVAVFPSGAVTVIKGTPTVWKYKSTARFRCPTCGIILFGTVPEQGLTGVKANLLPKGMFRPAFHIQCQYAVLPVKDELPHYKGFPAAFGGSDELVGW